MSDFDIESTPLEESDDQDLSDAVETISGLFPEGTLITFIAYQPGEIESAVIVTNDSLDDLSYVIEEYARRENEQ